MDPLVFLHVNNFSLSAHKTPVRNRITNCNTTREPTRKPTRQTHSIHLTMFGLITFHLPRDLRIRSKILVQLPQFGKFVWSEIFGQNIGISQLPFRLALWARFI